MLRSETEQEPSIHLLSSAHSKRSICGCEYLCSVLEMPRMKCKTIDTISLISGMLTLIGLARCGKR